MQHQTDEWFSHSQGRALACVPYTQGYNFWKSKGNRKIKLLTYHATKKYNYLLVLLQLANSDKKLSHVQKIK